MVAFSYIFCYFSFVLSNAPLFFAISVFLSFCNFLDYFNRIYCKMKSVMYDVL